MHFTEVNTKYFHGVLFFEADEECLGSLSPINSKF